MVHIFRGSRGCCGGGTAAGRRESNPVNNPASGSSNSFVVVVVVYYIEGDLMYALYGVYGATGGINKVATSVGFLFWCRLSRSRWWDGRLGHLAHSLARWVSCIAVKYSRCLQFPVRSYYARKSFDFCY